MFSSFSPELWFPHSPSLSRFCMMGLCRRPPILLLWLLLLVVFIIGDCHGSRSSRIHDTTFKPKPQNSGHFLGFLPKRMPIPASGPSRKHNDIGLQSWRSPWRSQHTTFLSFLIFFLATSKGDIWVSFFLFFSFLFFISLKSKQWRVGGYCIWMGCWVYSNFLFELFEDLAWRGYFFVLGDVMGKSLSLLHTQGGSGWFNLNFLFWDCIKIMCTVNCVDNLHLLL